MLKANKNTTRTAIEKVLSEYAKMYPINNFKKAFAFSKLLLEYHSVEFCNDTFIPMLEAHFGLNRTHWNNTRDKLTSSHIRDSFPYTWYALYHHIAFLLYQNENTSQKLGQEILSIYTTCISLMFCSFLRTHNIKNILLKRGYLNQGATVHLPTYLLIEIVIPKNTIEL